MHTTSSNKSKIATPFSQQLLAWYFKHARTMPWRIPPEDHHQGVRGDPYYVWLSEVMLQQTQVATVRDYFLKFVEKWPSIEALAAADIEDVLKAWAGLGYYSRARNLKKCADEVVLNHGGKFPYKPEQLKKLPGIGDYTASAIASIAFDEPVAVVDGNIERVITRHYEISTPLPAAKPEIQKRVSEVLDADKPGEFAQAMMDLGATICTPKRPVCGLCPINQDCAAFSSGDQELFPVKRPKPEKPTRKGAAFVICDATDNVFLEKRGEKGLLAGMSQVPTSNWTARQNGATGEAAFPFSAEWQMSGIARHTFTHFHLELEVWKTKFANEPPINGWWCKSESLNGEALPTLMKKVLAKAGF